jgi:predicted ATPase/DNA-binding SARP family transcriptional activator
VRVALLGPLQVLDDDDVEVTPRAPKRRAVLALLALRVNSVVRDSELIDALWGENPPLRADKLVQQYISDVRKVLPPDTIQTEPGGYRLCIPAENVDVTRFERLLRSGTEALHANDQSGALERFNEAFGLWRGQPLPDLADQVKGATDATHFTELYEGAREQSFDARLALGENESLIADLETAVAEQPLRERRWEQLMLALYRAGRQAEALRAYQRLRTTLQDQLAIDPREETRTLELAILNQDPSLQWAPPARSAGEAASLSLPSGNLTFLFTDIEGSTGLTLRLGAAYPETLEQHRKILRSSIFSRGGIEVSTAGDGAFIVFGDAGQALAACLEAQKAFKAHKWPPGGEVRVRMGLHTGIARIAKGGYMGLSVHEAHRICEAGHGGQVLLSAETATIVRHFLPDGCSLTDRGLFMLRGFDGPERIYQMVHREIDASFPPLRASLAQSHNLPDTQTSFVGREHELKALDGLLSEGRLVSIVGPGGVGKTRLAIEVGARLAPRFEWAIRLCDLSPLPDAALVPSGMAAAFGIRDESGSDPLAVVAQVLAEHEALLVLDSCEHLVEGAGVAVESLLASAPGLTVLATSRQPLGLDEERIIRIEPLRTPVAEAGFDAVHESEAVRLFENRARLAWEGFNVTEENASVVGEICRQLEGVPLAIELAAAQVSSLPLSTIAERLSSGFAVEKPGLHPGTDRHRTLEATVDWSYRLLDGDAQRFLRLLSVFANGFTIDAARAISDDEDPIAMLTTLVDKSLVVWDPNAARYRLLETIRAFARARLEESGELDVAGSRHLAWCATFADSLQTGGSRSDSYELFERELDNFRTALRWASNRESRPAAVSDQRRPMSREETASDAARLADAIQQPVASPTGAPSAPEVPAASIHAWEVEVVADRSYYERMESEGVEFPDSAVAKRFPLTGEMVTVGRRAGGVVPEIDLSAPPIDTGVSRDHAWLINQSDGGWSIVDPGSTNGIYLNDSDKTLPLGAITRLEDGDQVHIGAWTTITIHRVA